MNPNYHNFPPPSQLPALTSRGGGVVAEEACAGDVLACGVHACLALAHAVHLRDVYHSLADTPRPFLYVFGRGDGGGGGSLPGGATPVRALRGVGSNRIVSLPRVVVVPAGALPVFLAPLVVVSQ